MCSIMCPSIFYLQRMLALRYARALGYTYIRSSASADCCHDTLFTVSLAQILFTFPVIIVGWKHIQGVSIKVTHPKTFWNIFTSVESFCMKFCKFVDNSYPHIPTDFYRFILIFHQIALIFPRVPIVFTLRSFEYSLRKWKCSVLPAFQKWHHFCHRVSSSVR